MRALCWFSHRYGGDPANLDRAERAAEAFQREHPELLVVAPWILWARAKAHASEAEALADCCDFIRQHCRAIAVPDLDEEDLRGGVLREYAAGLDARCKVRIYQEKP